MGSWEVRGPVKGMVKSWRDKYPGLSAKVERIRVPYGRGIAGEGAEIWAYRDRPRNLAEILRLNAKKYPNKEAYVFYPGGQRLTWAEVGEKVNDMAYRLRQEYGFKKRDRLAILTLGSPEFVISYLATVTLGGIAVPVNLGLASSGIASQINKIGAKGLVVSPEMWETKVAAIRDQLDTVETVFVAGEEERPGCIPWSTLIKEKAAEQVAEDIDEWDLCAISFTSGTTGAPKGTMAMHLNAMGCAQVVLDILQVTDEDVFICMPPLYHNTAVYADFAPAFLSGAKLIVMASFDPLEAIKLIHEEKATACVAAPIMLWFIMNHPELRKYDCSSLKKIAFGGHAASETFIRQLLDVFHPVAAVNAGSVSESTAGGFALPTEDAIRKITSCGLATPCTEIAIFDDDGNEITEPHGIGEVAYKGQQTNAGYWEEPTKTSETFRKDGYVLSGDWAKFDEEGYLWLLDRKKDMVVRGGQNVYCIEVENKLYLLDQVLSAAVVGVPDHVFSERVKAVVVCKPGQTISADKIREHCAKHLAPYEVPEYVVFARAIPTNPAGKTLKRQMVDFWGEPEDAEDRVLAKIRGYYESMPPKLRDYGQFKLNDVWLTAEEALKHLEEGTEVGKQLREVIEQNGVVELLKPPEARFRG